MIRMFLRFSLPRERPVSPRTRRMSSVRLLARAQADSGAPEKMRSYQPGSYLVPRTAAFLQSGSYLIEEHEPQEG